MPTATLFQAILWQRKTRKNNSTVMTYACREWEELRIGRDGLSEAEVRQFHVCAERAARRLKTTVLARTPRGLKAAQVVGILQIPGAALEILPKIDGHGDSSMRRTLVRMLAVAWDLNVTHGELTDLETQRNDFLECLIRLFAERLLTAVRRGLPRRYLVHTEDLALLRGKLDIVRQLTHLSVRPDHLACRFDELSENTPLNRVLKAAVSRLARITRSASNARRLAELLSRFEFVGDSPSPLSEPVRMDRTNTAFHGLYRLARFFLSGDWQSTTSGDATRGFSLLFPMNDLFEEFVGRTIRRTLAHPVHLQHQGKHALVSEKGGPLFALRPDIVVDAADGPVVLDTKWKRLEPGDAKIGVKQSDVYQMLAYAHAYEARRLALIYPWCDGMGRPGLVRRWRIPETTCPLDIVTVDVGQPDSVGEVLCRLFEDDKDNFANPVPSLPVGRLPPHEPQAIRK